MVNAAPFVSRKGELNEWVLIAPTIKIKGVIEINGVVKAWLNIIMGAVAVNSARESPHDPRVFTLTLTLTVRPFCILWCSS